MIVGRKAYIIASLTRFHVTGCKFYTPQNARRLINVYAINFIP
jgi:hypothetical protein